MNPQGGFPQMDTEATVKQFKEFLSQYNRLTEMCFIDCAKDFTTRTVLKAEDTNLTLRQQSKFISIKEDDATEAAFGFRNVQPTPKKKKTVEDVYTLQCALLEQKL